MKQKKFSAPHFQFKNKKVVVLGGSGLLGAEIVSHFIAGGAKVINLDIQKPKRKSEAACWIEVDLSQPESILSSVRAAAKRLSGIDHLVHAAALVGTSKLDGWAVEWNRQSVEAWDRAMSINARSVLIAVQAAEIYLRKSRDPSVVLMSSIYGNLGPRPSLYQGTRHKNPIAYGASKGAVEQLTRYLAASLAPQVRVNAVAPGGIQNQQDPVFIKRYCDNTPLGRMGTPQDIVGAVLFLSSQWSSYITGQILHVDGGWSAW
jgi:NAD(P)-dependent dehydrogenase (short-subunit alcohol dehydrogenase family)